MKTIWKFTLGAIGSNLVDLPAKAKLLHVAYQAALVTVWAEVDPMEPRVRRNLYVAMTGEDFDREEVMTYVGTAQADGVYLVLHVYDGGEVGQA